MDIREMERGDAEVVRGMMKKFYGSPAVLSDVSEKIIAANVENFLSGKTCARAFVFVDGGKIVGYAVTATSYATEFGGECIWLEDIFIEAEYRGRGLASKFIRRVKELHPEKILRLEAEAGNDTALKLYERLGFRTLPYLEMVCVKG